MNFTPEEQQDIMQEVLLKVKRSIVTFTSHGPNAFKSFSSWTRRIARNYSLDIIRDEKREKVEYGADDVISEKPDTSTAEHHALRTIIEGDKELIEKALQSEKLTSGQRSALILNFWYGLDYAEIAQTLNIAEGTVKSRLNRGKERIKRFIEETTKLPPYSS